MLETALLLAITLGVFSTRAAYRNGFTDGAKWAHDSRYPSRPGAKWHGWAELAAIPKPLIVGNTQVSPETLRKMREVTDAE